MTSQLLQQVRVIDPVSETDHLADILIVDGVIKQVQERISNWSDDVQIRNCQGLIVGPGLVDLYSHSGEPGFEDRETLSSLVSTATAGGFTRLTLLPDTVPPIDNPAGLARMRERVGEAEVQLYFWGALTVGVQGQQMNQLMELAAAGVVGFADGLPLENLALVRRLLEYLKPLGKPVALWPCERQLVGNGVMREGTYSVRFGLPGNPAVAETTALASILELVEATGTRVHIMRVSTLRSVQLIQDAKARGLPITASTTWTHILLDATAINNYDPSLRLEPPLGNPGDLAALRQGLLMGVLDAIAIDHSPYTYEEKTVAFAEAPAGAIGLELALPLLWHNLVETGEWSALQLWRCLSTRPAECLQQTPSAIAPGKPAELIVFAPQQTWTVERQSLHTRSTNTPWLGQQLTGRVVRF